MTLWVTWLNLGYVTNFLSQWGKAFILAWPAATIISIVFGPYVQALTSLLFSITKKELI
ncbi:DUF2798 domain-containing protein [Vibrio kyushuensis]